MAAINFEIVITHGLQGGVGFVWHDTFIHDPFADPQYGAFPVDPVEQYGDAYNNSIFASDPAQAQVGNAFPTPLARAVAVSYGNA